MKYHHARFQAIYKKFIAAKISFIMYFIDKHLHKNKIPQRIDHDELFNKCLQLH